MFGEVAVPAAPGIAYGLLTLGAAVLFVVCLGLLWTWRHTLGALLVKIGNVSIFGGHPLGFVKDFSNQIEAYLSQAVAASEHAMVYSFHKMIGLFIWAGQEIAGLSTDIYNAIRGVEHTVVKPTVKVLDRKATVLINKVAGQVGTMIHVTIPALRHRVDALAHRVAHLAHVGAGAIAAPFPRLGRLEKQAKAQAGRLTRIEKALALGASAALVLTALKRLGLGWLRCSNVNRAGKAVCGMNPSLLEALLLDAVALTVAFNLEEFAEEMQTVTEEAASLIHNWAT